MKASISASIIMSMMASSSMAQTISPEERIRQLDIIRAQRQSAQKTYAEEQAKKLAKQKTENAEDYALAFFNKGEAQLKIEAICNFDIPSDTDPKNRALCDALMKASNRDGSLEISGGTDVPVEALRGQKIGFDGSYKTEGGTVFPPDYSKMSLKLPRLPGRPQSETAQKIESVSHKASFLYTLQKLGDTTGSVVKDIGAALKKHLNPTPQFLGFFTERIDGTTTPFFAAAVQFRKEFEKVVFLDKLGVKKVHITVLTNPFAMLTIKQVRQSVRSGPEFAEAYEEAAIHHISSATGIPSEEVRHLVPHSQIEEAIAQQKAIAIKDLNHRVSYANGLRTMINEAYATFFFTDTVTDKDGASTPKGGTGWTLRMGKISPNQQRDLLESSTNMMFSAGYQVSARMSKKTYAVTVAVEAKMGPWESARGGLVESYIRSIIEQGSQYFQLKPNSVDINLTLKSNWFTEHGIPVLNGLMIGSGAVSGRPFGYMRVDASHGPISGTYMGYWQACKEGREDWLGCYDHKGSQTRHFVLVQAEMNEFKNSVTKMISHGVQEFKYEHYTSKGSLEPFSLNRFVMGRELPKFIQRACGALGTCGLEFSVARVSFGETHEGPAGVSYIIGAGMIFSFGKPKPEETH